MALSRDQRWQVAVGAAAVAVLVVAVLVVVAESDGERGNSDVDTALDGAITSTSVPPPSSTLPVTTSTTVPSSSAPPTTASTTAPPGTTAPGTTASTQPPTTTRTVACRNSTNPACGPLTWDPFPSANQPMTVNFAYEPQPARVGQTVVFRLVVDDPDAPVSSCVTIERYGDGSPPATCAPTPCPPQYGPWTPVARPGHLERTFQHVYTRPGTYVASFGFTSESCGGSMIFGNAGSVDVNVVVGP